MTVGPAIFGVLYPQPNARSDKAGDIVNIDGSLYRAVPEKVTVTTPGPDYAMCYDPVEEANHAPVC